MSLTSVETSVNGLLLAKAGVKIDLRQEEGS
jgi:hypothetical protein